MKKAKGLLKVWLIFSWISLIYVTVKFLLGKADTFNTILVFGCWSVIIFNMILDVIAKVMNKVNDYRAYKQFVERLRVLRILQKNMHINCYAGNKEEVKSISTKIEEHGTSILEFGEYCIQRNVLSKRHIEEVQEMLAEVKNLMNE